MLCEWFLTGCVFFLLRSASLVEYLHVVLRPVIDLPLLFTQSEVTMLLTFKKTCFPDLNELKCDVHIGHGDASVMLKVTTLWSSLCVST